MAGDTFLPGFPGFVNELAGTLSVHSQFVLHGNLRDLYLRRTQTGAAQPNRLMALLWQALQPSGYQCLICYDLVDGITVYPHAAQAQAAKLIGSRALGRRPSLERLRVHLAKVVGVREQPPMEVEAPPSRADSAAGGSSASPQTPGQAAAPVTSSVGPVSADSSRTVTPSLRCAFVIDHATRITRVPGQLDPVERDFFLYCQKLALTAEPARPGGAERALYNPIIWLAENESDLPAWLTAGVERIRSISIGTPTLHDRETMARALVPMLPGATALDQKTLGDSIDTFARRTDGMTLHAMAEITLLARDRQMTVDRIGDAARIYRFGIDDNPWRRDSVKKQIARGERMLAERVLGQDRAVAKTLDILKRSALGLSGAQATTSVTRPRGVLFFAGPTGVGKTETAKQVAEMLFGDANAYLRFDMSEFAADHSADRLIGAPPGYVGFEAGGELTNAVRRNPFQVVLFDEIEKAHKLVLDKFLQILEDGRLTDGHGVTTYFSECVLIFTSNLGVMRTDPNTGQRTAIVAPGLSYEELEATVTGAVREHFTKELGRPELLNRLGDNIVVFDFIGPAVADRILDLQLRNVAGAVDRELQLDLRLSDTVRKQLNALCTVQTGNGGRGIGNLLETHLINPLSRLLFDGVWQPDSTVEVTGIGPGGDLEATVRPGRRQ